MRMRRVVAVFIPALLLPGCEASPVDPTRVEAPAPAFNLSGDVITAGAGTPVIDGVFSAGEWSAAGTIEFDVQLPEGGTARGTWYVLNDGANLYMAVRFPRGTGDTGNALAFEFDNDADGVYADGNDVIVFSEGSGFRDDFRVEVAGVITGPPDVDHGGTSDGTGAFSNDGTFSLYEMSHPLDTADDAHDFSLAPAGLVGASVQLRIFDAAGQSSDTFFPGPTPLTYLSVQLAGVNVAIDIAPGSSTNVVNLSSSGMLVVGILSTAAFDATTINGSTVRFGPALAPEAHGRTHATDLNGDGLTDVLLHFRISETGISAGDTMACIQGTTAAGVPFSACDAIVTS